MEKHGEAQHFIWRKASVKKRNFGYFAVKYPRGEAGRESIGVLFPEEIEELCSEWGGIRLDKLPPEQMRTLIRELVEKIIVYDDGPNAHRVRVVLNPGKVRPPDQPPDYVSTPFDKLGTLLDRTVYGLPLPPLPGNVVVLPQGLLVTEFSMFRR